ncbi:MAG: S8 family serine peptidase [Saprospiraceae bacterium]|nr:S8 family serine peptidase [Saprospiraceae bacterium]MDP4999171.1 S8 family serine peptidase [Saprospiraceae bacterium]
MRNIFLSLSRCCSLVAVLSVAGQLFAQSPDGVAKNWHLQAVASGTPGISLSGAYAVVKGLPAKKVIVAVIDNGVDIDHEDLREVIWVNSDEIPGNGRDDDGNGYVDDVYGWNFLGNASGENVHYDNLEMTRIYAHLSKRFAGKALTDIAPKDKPDFERYQEYGKEIEDKVAEYASNYQLYGVLDATIDTIIAVKGSMDLSKDELLSVEIDHPGVMRFRQPLAGVMEAEGWTFAELAKQIEESFEYFYARYNFYYNPEWNSRALIGDDPNNPKEIGYGNPDVKGPDPFHGTHAAGVIAAVRNNDLGMDGVADQVQIMAIRAVPDGDEHDKDVANAIRYAVDNGASIINLSFGKGASPLKGVVDAAVRYAEKKDVLIVHSAGNDAKENKPDGQFPNDQYQKAGFLAPKQAKNWIEVGASGPEMNEQLAASFTNYSSVHVDILAPGVSIYSTYPNNSYDWLDGTSFSAPVVSGVAALIRAYFPGLRAKEVREILLESAYKPGIQVMLPGSEDAKVALSDLCATGGLVDAKAALELARARANN